MVERLIASTFPISVCEVENETLTDRADCRARSAQLKVIPQPRELPCIHGANGEGRTPMALRPLEPKSSASASSATLALSLLIIARSGLFLAARARDFRRWLA